ncbi:MAG: Gfo/Idh/MocA family oxidoreductase [Lactovum sp.]
MEKLTIAYIGNGKSANRYHIPFSLKTGKIRIKKIFSPEETSIWKTISDVEYVKDLNDIWADEDIQLVVLCTPHDTHYPLAKEALEKGKNVLVEKPFTETPEEARELFALAKEKGLLIQCYQNRRYDSDFLTVQKVIESGLLGDILEVEMSYDYYRPEIPTKYLTTFSKSMSYLYGHGCHTLDQVISYWGMPDKVNYDVRQILGKGRMNDYFDLDLYYGGTKISVKSSYFRIKQRPRFTVYGKKGMFVKATDDRQEEHLKLFYMPDNADFGIDKPEHYGTLTYYDEQDIYHEEKIISEVGDYSRVYEGLYEAIINGAEKTVKDEETIRQIEILWEGINTIDEDLI